MTEKNTEVRRMDQQTTEMAQVTPAQMIDRAITSGATVEVLERLMALQERWQANQARAAFAAALAALRDDLPRVVKTRTVDFTTSKGRTHYQYEDLAEITEALSEPLARHGLSFRWRTDSETRGMIKVTCILEHEQGHNEETALSGPYDDSGNKNAIQAIGSVVTYLQRYTLKAALGLAAARDDDGRQGAGTKQPAAASKDQLAEMRRIMADETITEKERAGIEKRIANHMTAEQADAAIDWLKKTIKQRTPGPSEDQAAEAAAPSEGDGEPAGEQVHPVAWDAWLKLAKQYRASLGDEPYYAVLARWEAKHADDVEGQATAEVAAALHEAAVEMSSKDAPPPSTGALVESLDLKKDELAEGIADIEKRLHAAEIEPPREAYGIGEDTHKHVVAELRTYFARLSDVLAETQAQESFL